ARAELISRHMPYTDSLDDAIRAVHGWLDWSASPSPAAPERPSGLPAAPSDLPAGALDPQTLFTLLSAYGLPAAEQAVASDRDTACAAAARLGYPVVLKAIGRDLVHKSDAGGVTLGLGSASDVVEALDAMQRRVPGLDGFLVQRMERGDVELIVGV